MLSSNHIIKIARGDSVSFDFMIDLATKFDMPQLKYTLTDYDTVYFGIMLPHQPFEDAIIKKKYTRANMKEDGKILIEITSADTMNLESGIYYYEIKLKTRLGVRTLITKKKFVVGD